MNIFTLTSYATRYFSKLNIQFKDKSNFMKLISYILFFNREFMTSYTTTIGETIYFPKENYIRIRYISSIIILLHELVHVFDSNRLSNPIYSFLYLFPQSLIIFTIPIFFFSWKIALIASILCLLPFPAYFRMQFEKRAYLASLYVIYKLSIKFNFNIDLDRHSNSFIKNFKNSSYYFMWIFSDINKQFSDALIKIKANKHPYDSAIFDILDDLISQVKSITNS